MSPSIQVQPSKKLIRVQVHSSVANWNWPIIVPHYGSIRSGTLWGTLCSSVRRYKPINSSKQIRFTSTCRTGAREDLQCQVTVITAPLSRKTSFLNSYRTDPRTDSMSEKYVNENCLLWNMLLGAKCNRQLSCLHFTPVLHQAGLHLSRKCQICQG